MGELLSLLSVLDAMMKCLTDYTINVGIAVYQSFYLILDALNSPSGFFASVAEGVYLAECLIKTV
jgi:hypothetical protein